MMKKLLLETTFLLSCISGASAEIPKFLDTDKVWEYGYSYMGMIDLQEYIVLYKYRLEGTEEYNGKTYQVLYECEQKTWSVSHVDDTKDNGHSKDQLVKDVQTTETWRKVALLRQEDNKVYMPYMKDYPKIFVEDSDYTVNLPEYNKDMPDYLGLVTYTPDDSNPYNVEFTDSGIKEGDEITIFDFSAEVGTSVNLWGCNSEFGWFCNDDYVIAPYQPALYHYDTVEVSDDEINSTEIRTIKTDIDPDNNMQFLRSYEFNSLAGALGTEASISKYKYACTTILGAVQGGDMTTSVSSPVRNYFFNNLYDSKGNILFEGSNAVPPEIGDGVRSIVKDEEASCMCDLMGREIKNPLPGTIYIQNGRKMIAR